MRHHNELLRLIRILHTRVVYLQDYGPRVYLQDGPSYLVPCSYSTDARFAAPCAADHYAYCPH
jgi:hypothetical protein